MLLRFDEFDFGDSPVQVETWKTLKGLGDSLHDLLCTELRQQRDRGGSGKMTSGSYDGVQDYPFIPQVVSGE